VITQTSLLPTAHLLHAKSSENIFKISIYPARPAGYIFCCCFLFLFVSSDSCQTNYFKIYRTNLRQIFLFGGTTAVDDQSEISFSIPQGTLP